nr:hypothetical protein CFP56_31780 [Quercus suber]
MVEHSHRSYLKDCHGPRAVDSSGRKHRDDGAHRSKRDSRYRRKVSVPIRSPLERPEFILDMVGQPPKNLTLDSSVQISVMLSLRTPDWTRRIDTTDIDTSRLIAAVSLTTTSRTGEVVPLEAGLMVGQQMFDSVHPIPESCRDRLATRYPRRLALGYFTFPSLMFRQAGVYSIRATLIDIAGSEGSTSMLAVDSEQVKVERRTVGTQRRLQSVKATVRNGSPVANQCSSVPANFYCAARAVLVAKDCVKLNSELEVSTAPQPCIVSRYDALSTGSGSRCFNCEVIAPICSNMHSMDMDLGRLISPLTIL